MTDSTSSTTATPTSPDPSTADLLALISEQRRELDDLRARVERAESVASVRSAGSPGAGVADIVGASGSSRRQMLRRVGTVAAGAAVVAPLIARPAAAATGDPFVTGAQNTSDRTTLLFGPIAEPNTSVLGVADTPTEIDVEAAIAGMATGAGPGGAVKVYNGVVGYTETADTNVENGHALVANPQRVPGKVSPRSNIWLRPLLDDPRVDTKEHTVGEVVSDTNGDVWHCVVPGTPGVWRRLSGARTSGAFAAIRPTRVYDSRLSDGRIFTGQQRIVSVADSIDPATGVVNDADIVPPGATAVAYNLAAANTRDRGFLFLAPAEITAVTGASINWSENTGQVNNGSVVALGPNRQIRISCGQGGSCEVVVDIVGYYL